MKILISLIMLLSCLPAFGNLASRELKCSRAGTDVLLVNGISWGRQAVDYILYKQIEPSLPKNYLDNKASDCNYVKFKYSY